jgi:hypothetical protein
VTEPGAAAGDDAQVGSGVERREDPWTEQSEAAVGDERGDDGDLGGVSEERPELGGEGIVVAAGGEWGSALAGGGEAPGLRELPARAVRSVGVWRGRGMT